MKEEKKKLIKQVFFVRLFYSFVVVFIWLRKVDVPVSRLFLWASEVK
jgi:hypothetical protein